MDTSTIVKGLSKFENLFTKKINNNFCVCSTDDLNEMNKYYHFTHGRQACVTCSEDAGTMVQELAEWYFKSK